MILREKTIMNSSNPLFILDNASIYNDNDIILGGSTMAQPPRDESGDRAIIRFDSRQISIKNGYRYEASGASEYGICGYRIESNGTVHWVYDASGQTVIADISNNQIGQLVNHPHLHAYNWTPYSANRFFWNTFERDWYSSEKPLGNATFGGITIYLGGNRALESEWYAWIPSTLQDHATPFEWYGWETNVNFASWKADYYVWRIDG